MAIPHDHYGYDQDWDDDPYHNYFTCECCGAYVFYAEALTVVTPAAEAMGYCCGAARCVEAITADGYMVVG
jgi:hypothetical protein